MQNLVIGGSESGLCEALLKMANRHGLIAGATGTGKTVTLQVLAESFSQAGVPVFLADVKGDLSGLAQAIQPNEKIEKRLAKIGLTQFQPQGNPCLFWDLHATNGHPVRTTLSEIGPLLLANMLGLNDVQEGVLYSAFKISDEEGLLLLDLKDLQALLAWMAEEAKALSARYGNISRTTVGAIQRKLLVLEEQGAEHFFAEPALKLDDLMHTDFGGRGVISILNANILFSKSPRLYASFLLWLLSELFETLPEIGDPEKPKLVFFFDEAHLLFDETPKSVVDKIEQVVRLIRSKGVGVYFISQNPDDVPDEVLGQLGLRIQHALRAFTPRDQQAIKTAARTFRPNPKLNTEEVITQLGIGEALVSMLDEKGAPTPVERVLIRPPQSQIGPIPPDAVKKLIAGSPLAGRYDQMLDRHSAYEELTKRAEQAEAEAEAAKRAQAEEREARTSRASSRPAERETSRTRREPERSTRTERTTRTSRSGGQSVTEAFFKSAARSFGSQVGRKVFRGLLGSLLK